MVDLPNENNNLFEKDSFKASGEPEEYVSGSNVREEMKQFKPQTGQQASWQQKFAVVFLALFGISAVVLWAVQFNSGLKVTKPLTNEELASLQNSNNSETAALQNQDSDLDGISDYNELYLYNTSPYIEDTDSDGISDKAEIDAGEDPNCPIGQNCFSQETSDQTEPSDSAETSNNNQNNGIEAGEGNFDNYLEQSEQTDSELDADRDLMQAILGGEADAQSLRQLLLDAGMDKNTLNNFSDEQLIGIYQNTLQGQQ